MTPEKTTRAALWQLPSTDCSSFCALLVVVNAAPAQNRTLPLGPPVRCCALRRILSPPARPDDDLEVFDGLSFLHSTGDTPLRSTSRPHISVFLGYMLAARTRGDGAARRPAAGAEAARPKARQPPSRTSNC